MNEAEATIVTLERRVMWRQRFLLLQDLLTLAFVIGLLVAAVFVAIVRLRPLSTPVYPVLIGIAGILIVALLIRWVGNRASRSTAASSIDSSMNLDDRIATAHLILERGGPKSAIEQAQIEDAASKLRVEDASTIVPYRTRSWYAFAVVAAVAFTGAYLIPQRSLPVDQAMVAEKADIESAGLHLEQTSAEIEASVPSETDTAGLAREQAEIGRGFRRASSTRAEALRRLSALEERIRQRHGDLASTRAEEIVSLADRRLGNVVDTLSTSPRKRKESDNPDPSLGESSNAESRALAANEAGKRVESATDPAKPGGTGSEKLASAKDPQPNAPTGQGRQKQTNQQTKATKPVTGAETPEQKSPGSERPPKVTSDPGAPPNQKPTGESSERPTPEAKPDSAVATDPKLEQPKLDQPKPDQPKTGDGLQSQPPGAATELLKAVPTSLAQQAAKALPKLSEELLKKAAELRAKELSQADIEKLRKAAESLAGDLKEIGQSKELQKALAEMARQVRPEEIEQVARELGNQEKLKQELQAATRLLSENQQAKEMVAGVAGELSRMKDQRRQQEAGSRGDGNIERRSERGSDGDTAGGNKRVGGSSAGEKLPPEDRKLAGQGREASLNGKLQQRPGGEYVFLKARAEAGAARVPYSSAYPQYRREAERSVQRSRVPPNLRSVVRKYFDAINPDTTK